MIKQLQCRGGT